MMGLAPRSKMVSTTPAKPVQRRFLKTQPDSRGAVCGAAAKRANGSRETPGTFFTSKPTERRRWQNLELHFSYRQSLPRITNRRAVRLQIQQRLLFLTTTTPSPSLSPSTPFNVLIFLRIGQHTPPLDRHSFDPQTCAPSAASSSQHASPTSPLLRYTALPREMLHPSAAAVLARHTINIHRPTIATTEETILPEPRRLPAQSCHSPRRLPTR